MYSVTLVRNPQLACYGDLGVTIFFFLINLNDLALEFGNRQV